MPAEQRRTPAVTRRWELELRATGTSGDLRFYCPRCATPAVIELTAADVPPPGAPPACVTSACTVCGVPVLIALEGPPPTRPPHAYSRPPARMATAAPPPFAAEADPQAAADADEPLFTLAEWQAKGLGLSLHPNTAAAVPRARDERPGRRNPDGLRVYSRREIEAAEQQQHPNNHHHQNTATEPNNNTATQERFNG